MFACFDKSLLSLLVSISTALECNTPSYGCNTFFSIWSIIYWYLHVDRMKFISHTILSFIQCQLVIFYFLLSRSDLCNCTMAHLHCSPVNLLQPVFSFKRLSVSAFSLSLLLLCATLRLLKFISISSILLQSHQPPPVSGPHGGHLSCCCHWLQTL